MLQILTKVFSALSVGIGCPPVFNGTPFWLSGKKKKKALGIYKLTFSFHQRQRMPSAPL